MESLDAKSGQSELAELNKRNTIVRPSWSETSAVDSLQIYTQLSWMKEEEISTVTSHPKLINYTDVFTGNKKGLLLLLTCQY